MRIHVLGSAAGGGYPQWNCHCTMCRAVREQQAGHTARTQSSIAVGHGNDWLLVNASPDVRQQILAFPALQPGRALRDTGIRGVLLMDSQIDHCTGLLMLRESAQPLPLYCTRRVYEDLCESFPIATMLSHYGGTRWHEIQADGTPFAIEGLDGLRFSAVALESKAPPYSPHRERPAPGDNIGLCVENSANGLKAFYAPGLGAMDDTVRHCFEDADLLLVDGTCWTDDEMSLRGVGRKLARQMGHLPQSGAGGMIETLAAYPDKRRVLIHINNTNPILNELGPERAELKRQGIEVAEDGMELVL